MIGFVGIVLVQVPVYIAEIAPQDMRGSLGSVNQVGCAFEPFYSYCFCYSWCYSCFNDWFNYSFYEIALSDNWNIAVLSTGTFC
jgi:hypothetical protein